MIGKGTQRPRVRNDHLHSKPEPADVRPHEPGGNLLEQLQLSQGCRSDPRADAERVLYAPRSATRSRHARRVNVDVAANRGFGPKDPHRHPAHDSTRGRRLSPAQTDRRERPVASATWRTRPWIPCSSRHIPMDFCLRACGSRASRRVGRVVLGDRDRHRVAGMPRHRMKVRAWTPRDVGAGPPGWSSGVSQSWMSGSGEAFDSWDEQDPRCTRAHDARRSPNGAEPRRTDYLESHSQTIDAETRTIQGRPGLASVWASPRRCRPNRTRRGQA
jgi:hypothetical protein